MFITQITSPLQLSISLYDLMLEFFKSSMKTRTYIQIAFNCHWIKSCKWLYYVFRNMVFCQLLLLCSRLYYCFFLTYGNKTLGSVSVFIRSCYTLTHMANFSVCHSYYEISVIKISLSNNCAVIIFGVWPPDKSKIPELMATILYSRFTFFFSCVLWFLHSCCFCVKVLATTLVCEFLLAV